MLAVKHGKIDLVELLIENSAGVNLQDADGSTALMCAVEHEAFDIVKMLLARPECDVNIADNVRKIILLPQWKIFSLIQGWTNCCQYCNE